ncbi:urease accessory protein UreE [Vulcanococcus sp.]|jgi:urease accessory protein|uniref:urease accessory protein UreE n=1 Tax=Vulcanococcus sp. TaxID=2856995 RepID=UPI00341A2B00
MITEWHPSARQGAAHSADSIHLMSHAAAIQLVERLSDQAPLPPAGTVLQLPLAADQRTSLRGHRRSACGLDLLLQLPRGAALRPGERLATADGQIQVQVEAAAEPVMQVRSADPLALLQAVYHLGNRHVAMELHADRLVLLQDSVLADLLRQRGLAVELAELPFQPEAGAYEGLGHHHHGHHDHGHSHP